MIWISSQFQVQEASQSKQIPIYHNVLPLPVSLSLLLRWSAVWLGASPHVTLTSMSTCYFKKTQPLVRKCKSVFSADSWVRKADFIFHSSIRFVLKLIDIFSSLLTHVANGSLTSWAQQPAALSFCFFFFFFMFISGLQTTCQVACSHLQYLSV